MTVAPLLLGCRWGAS